MRFNAWSMERIEKGTKHLTSRKKNHQKDPHVIAVVGPLPWWFIRECLYEHEGADSPEELQHVIDGIFKRRGYPVADDELFFVHVIDREAVIGSMSGDRGVLQNEFQWKPKGGGPKR